MTLPDTNKPSKAEELPTIEDVLEELLWGEHDDERQAIKEADATIQAILSHDRQQLLRRVGEEVIGQDDARLPKFMTRAFVNDKKYDIQMGHRNQLRDEQHQRLDTIRKEEEK